MPEFKLHIDLGHIITIGTLLVVMGAAWGNLSSIREAHAGMASDIKGISQDVNTLKVQSGETQVRLERVERELDKHIEDSLEYQQRNRKR